jgi:hypothetical protein
MDTILFIDQAIREKVMFLDSVYRYAKQQSRGLSGASAAKELGLSSGCFNTYVNWQNSNKFPSDETIKKLAVFINWDYDDVFLAVQAARVANTSLCSKLESIISAKEPKHISKSNII